MGLDFTNIADTEGAALYILHTGNTREIENFQRLAADIAKETTHQVVLIDVNTAEGENVRDFYDFMPEQLPIAFIIKDDDSIAEQWGKEYIPAASDIAFQLRRISN